MSSDKSVTQFRLFGQYLTVLEVKMSCWALLASVRLDQLLKTICQASHALQPIRKCHKSHIEQVSFPTWQRLQWTPSHVKKKTGPS